MAGNTINALDLQIARIITALVESGDIEAALRCRRQLDSSIIAAGTLAVIGRSLSTWAKYPTYLVTVVRSVLDAWKFPGCKSFRKAWRLHRLSDRSVDPVAVDSWFLPRTASPPERLRAPRPGLPTCRLLTAVVVPGPSPVGRPAAVVGISCCLDPCKSRGPRALIQGRG